MKFLDRIFGKKNINEDTEQTFEEMTCEEVYNAMKRYAEEHYHSYSINYIGYSEEDVEYMLIIRFCKEDDTIYNTQFDKLVSEGKKLKEILFKEPTKKLKIDNDCPEIPSVHINGNNYYLKY